jgi:hypothetical protein
MPDISTLLKGIPKTLPAADQLDRALEACSQGNVPELSALGSPRSLNLSAIAYR